MMLICNTFTYHTSLRNQPRLYASWLGLLLKIESKYCARWNNSDAISASWCVREYTLTYSSVIGPTIPSTTSDAPR